MEIRFAKREEMKEISRLTEVFAKENCCNNIIADNEDYLIEKKILIALEGEQIIGYVYGSFEEEKTLRSYAKPHDKYFELEEIYVLPQYRNNHVGQTLFCEIEKYATNEGAKTLRLNAVSKNYKSLLRFYIEILGMDFISAYLVKDLSKS